MFRTMICLPDGTEISSGADADPTIQHVSIVHTVNDGQELSLGSVCTAMVELTLFCGEKEIQLFSGEEIKVYRIDDAEVQHCVGLFTLEKPACPSANTLKLTAYDRITWLDKDVASYLMNLPGWPYKLLDLAELVCNHCGLTLKNTQIPNGDYLVQKFSAGSITGRKIMQWAGEIAGRFCRATPEGEIEFAWYEPSGVSVTPDGDRFYYDGGLSYEDYQIAPIEKVQLRLTENDVGVVWPDETGEKNTYVISGNYLLTADASDALLPLAQTLYGQLKDITYTPCKVTIPAGTDIKAGHTVQITDRNGVSFTTYVMTKTQTEQRDTLECTGSFRRDSTTAVNNEGYRALSGKMLEIQKEIEGLIIAATKIERLKIGTRNLIRNSNHLIFKDYYFAETERHAICGTFLCGEAVSGQ